MSSIRRLNLLEFDFGLDCAALQTSKVSIWAVMKLFFKNIISEKTFKTFYVGLRFGPKPVFCLVKAKLSEPPKSLLKMLLGK